MGKVVLNTPQGKVNITIAGDKPTIEESIQINNIIRQTRSGQAISKDEPTIGDKVEQLFDTSTGIKSNALRSALSVAETREEEDAILRKFDLIDDDFLRDNRGRLALTPTGASKFGQETDRNILIDEEGFSRYDFSDLAGIVPELVGAVGGAIAGQIAIPIPILGGAIGAGIGAGGGQALEEAGEALAGVQRQTGEEIGKDVLKEAAIGFVGDGLFGLAAGAFRATRRAMTPGKDLTKAEYETVGKSLEQPLDEAGNVIKKEDFAKLSADEQVAAVNRGGFNILPTLSAIRAPSLVARIQAIGEKIFKTSDRLKNNNDRIRQIINAYKTKFGGADDITGVDVGDILTAGMKANNKAILASEKKLQEEVTKHLKDVAEQFKTATTKNLDVDTELFNIMKDSSDAFDSIITGKFKSVDQVLNEVVGNTRIYSLKPFEAHLNKILTDYASTIANKSSLDGRAFSSIRDSFKAISGGKETMGAIRFEAKASFNQLYNLRKTISDLRMNASQTVKNEITNPSGTGLLDELDNVFKQMGDENSAVFREISDGITYTPDLNKLKKAGKTLKGAQAQFFEGKNIIEDLYTSTTIKQLDQFKDLAGPITKSPMNIDIYQNVVKPNNPNFLQRAMQYIADHGGKLDQTGKVIKGSGKDLAEQFRIRAANQFIEDAIKSSGLKNFKNAKDFNGTKFAKAFENLGSTAKILFGKDTDQILKLADEVGNVKITGLQTDTVLNDFTNIAADTVSNQTLIGQLKRLSDVQKRLVANQNNNIIKKLQSDIGDLDPVEASNFIIQGSTKNSQIKPIMEYFRRLPNNQGDESIKKIQGYYINSMIDDFGESIMTDGKSLNAFADRILGAAKDGKLTTIYGKELGKNMEDFGKVLKFNARSAEGGDLVAANIAASPFQNVGKLVKFSILGNRLLSKSYYDDVLNQYKGITLKQFKSPADRAKSLGSIIGKSLSQSVGQSIQNVYDEGEKQVDAVLESSGVKSQIQNTAQQLAPAINQARTGVNQVGKIASAPNIMPPAGGTQIAGIDVTNPANALSLGLNPTDVAIAQRTRGLA